MHQVVNRLRRSGEEGGKSGSRSVGVALSGCVGLAAVQTFQGKKKGEDGGGQLDGSHSLIDAGRASFRLSD